MRRLISSLILVIASFTLGAQSLTPEVVASAGESFSNNTLNLDWTLGELMTESYAGTIVLTQGFHQPKLNATAIEDFTPDFGAVKVYPNPTSGSIFIEREKSGSLELTLLDMKGSIIMQKTVLSAFGNLNLSHLPKGIYILRMYDEKKASKSIRIKKL